MDAVCRHCGEPLEPPSDPHARRIWCSSRCRSRGYRRRQVGMPESSYPAGAARGRVALALLTYAQQRVQWDEIAAEFRATHESVYERRGLRTVGR